MYLLTPVAAVPSPHKEPGGHHAQADQRCRGAYCRPYRRPGRLRHMLFRIGLGSLISVLVQSHLQHLGEVQCLTIRRLGDLFAAAKAVGNDHGFG